jgi:hypothetical protein
MRAGFLIWLLLFFTLALAQNQAAQVAGTEGSQASKNDSSIEGMPELESDNAVAAQSMEKHQLDMGPHMKMTALRPLEPGDQAQADRVLEAARATAEKYRDYRLALADGYKIFMPNLPQKQYHFTNYWNAFRARTTFDPSRPTSLLYEKTGDNYKLIGVMYTDRKDATETELNSRIPLSIAQWHAHVNLCLPPRQRREETTPPNAQFGLAGSIATKEACDAAGGRFVPQIFGWMVHVYPFEQNPAEIWSVERQGNQ